MSEGNSNDFKIIYVGDPMCSWCYGFSPEIAKVKSHFEGSADFELVMGGLRPYNTETMTELKSFLTGHWQDVQEASGQPFAYGILDESDITYDTEPSCRAVVTVRHLAPEKEMEFFSLVQTAFYSNNKDMHQIDSYKSALNTLDIPIDKFNTLFDSDKMREAVRKDFQRSANLDVSGFPTVLVQRGDDIKKISSGYLKADALIKRIKSEVKNR